MPYIWPDKLRPGSVQHIFDDARAYGPQPFAGRAQAVMGDAGVLRLRCANYPVFSDRVLLYRAFMNAVDQGVTACYVPMYDRIRAPRRLAGLSPLTGLDFGDGWTFLDETDFAGRTDECVLHADAAARDTTIVVEKLAAVTLRPGHPFQLGKFVYFGGVLTPDGVDPDIVTISKIFPPLRADHTAGDHIELDDPYCLMVCETKPEMRAPDLLQARRGAFSLDWIEADPDRLA